MPASADTVRRLDMYVVVISEGRPVTVTETVSSNVTSPPASSSTPTDSRGVTKPLPFIQIPLTVPSNADADPSRENRRTSRESPPSTNPDCAAALEATNTNIATGRATFTNVQPLPSP